MAFKNSLFILTVVFLQFQLVHLQIEIQAQDLTEINVDEYDDEDPFSWTPPPLEQLQYSRRYEPVYGEKQQPAESQETTTFVDLEPTEIEETATEEVSTTTSGSNNETTEVIEETTTTTSPSPTERSNEDDGNDDGTEVIETNPLKSTSEPPITSTTTEYPTESNEGNTTDDPAIHTSPMAIETTELIVSSTLIPEQETTTSPATIQTSSTLIPKQETSTSPATIQTSLAGTTVTTSTIETVEPRFGSNQNLNLTTERPQAHNIITIHDDSRNNFINNFKGPVNFYQFFIDYPDECLKTACFVEFRNRGKLSGVVETVPMPTFGLAGRGKGWRRKYGREQEQGQGSQSDYTNEDSEDVNSEESDVTLKSGTTSATEDSNQETQADPLNLISSENEETTKSSNTNDTTDSALDNDATAIEEKSDPTVTQSSEDFEDGTIPINDNDDVSELSNDEYTTPEPKGDEEDDADQSEENPSIDGETAVVSEADTSDTEGSSTTTPNDVDASFENEGAKPVITEEDPNTEEAFEDTVINDPSEESLPPNEQTTESSTKDDSDQFFSTQLADTDNERISDTTPSSTPMPLEYSTTPTPTPIPRNVEVTTIPTESTNLPESTIPTSTTAPCSSTEKPERNSNASNRWPVRKMFYHMSFQPKKVVDLFGRLSYVWEPVYTPMEVEYYSPYQYLIRRL